MADNRPIEFRVSPPVYPTDTENLYRSLIRIADALNAIPAFSFFSTMNGPNVSGITGIGFGIETGSSATTTLWYNRSGLSNTWIAYL